MKLRVYAGLGTVANSYLRSICELWVTAPQVVGQQEFRNVRGSTSSYLLPSSMTMCVDEKNETLLERPEKTLFEE